MLALTFNKMRKAIEKIKIKKKINIKDHTQFNRVKDVLLLNKNNT